MERKTLLQLEEIIRTEAENNQSVNSYYYGVEDIVNKYTDLKSICIRMAPDSVTFNSKVTNFTIILEAWAETLENDDDRLVVESEALDVLNDLINSIANGFISDGGFQLPRDSDGNLIGGMTAISLVHEKESRLTGWQITLDVIAPNNYDFCMTPNNV